MQSPVSKFGMTSWTGKETTDDHRIVYGNEVVVDDPPPAEDPPVEDPVEPGAVDEVFVDPNFTVFNDFEGNTAEQMHHVMSNHENRRNHYANDKMVMGVRDTAVIEGQYEPTAEKPLNISFDANFPKADSLYILTRSELSTDVGGYRSLNEVRTELDAHGKTIKIHEVKGGAFNTIATLENVDLPMNEDLHVELTDDGSTITIIVGAYELTANTRETYHSFGTGLAVWSTPVTVDNYGALHGNDVPQQELDPLTAKVQEAVSAELTVQLNEEAAALSEDFDTESQMLLTSVSVNNRELSRIQGIQLFERSSFYIHGNQIEPILRNRFPDIFPENLAEYVQRQAEILNEEPGHIQDRILMQQSDYRGILRGLLGTFENTMSDLLNITVDKVAQMQAGNLSEYNLMRDLREAIGRANTGRYILEIADFYIHIPSAEELYREGERLFTEEQVLLQRIQSEQDRLVQIDNFRASFREWQLGHGVPDLAILIGEDRGTADNGYDGILDAREERRLVRAQWLVEAAMGAMLDRRIQMRVVPDEVTIENRLVYGGGGVTYMEVHTSEYEVAVQGVLDVIVEYSDDRYAAEVGISEGGISLINDSHSDAETRVKGVSTLISSETIDLPVGTNELNRWWATAGEGPIDIDWSVHVENEGEFVLHVQKFDGWDIENTVLVVDGVHEMPLIRTVSGFRSEMDLSLPAGGHTFTLRGVGVPQEVGVEEGKLDLTRISSMYSVTEAQMSTLMIADHEEEFLNAGKIFRVEGQAEVMDVNELINHFAPILHFHPDERFATPFAVENIEIDSSGSTNSNIDLSQFESGSFDAQNTEGAMYASVLRDSSRNEIAINYSFFYPRSNWGEHGGFNTHEGDWEGATVFLKMDGDMRWVPDRIAVAQHEKRLGTQPSLNDGGDIADWSELNTAGSHPHLFVGLGGHATYISEDVTNIAEFGKTYPESHIDNNYTGIDDGVRVPVIYMPRASSASERGMDWLLYTGSWGTDKHDLGGNAPNGPLYIGGGFESGTRWLNPWLWGYDFK